MIETHIEHACDTSVNDTVLDLTFLLHKNLSNTALALVCVEFCPIKYR